MRPITITYQAPHLAGIRVGGFYEGPLRQGLRAIKYGHAKAAAPALAGYLESAVQQNQATIIIPVPLHRSRLRQRGHNQAALLATSLARHTGLPLNTRLVRTRATASQTTLDKPRRAANVRGAFRWRGGSLRNQTVVIVDDVTTTGATLSACAQALKSAHPHAVWGVAIAKKT
jgi:ComF family protein